MEGDQHTSVKLTDIWEGPTHQSKINRHFVGTDERMEKAAYRGVYCSPPKKIDIPFYILLLVGSKYEKSYRLKGLVLTQNAV